MPLSASHIPNIISALRLAATPVLVALAYLGQREAFAWLLVAALLSDIVDGAIARHFGFTSELGARLDSIADLLLFGVAAYGIWVFHMQVVTEHSGVFLLVVGLWIGGALAGFLRYGRMASFHTFLSRVSAYAMGGFIAVLFLWGFNAWLFWAGVGLAVAAQIEEFILLALLPVWTPNVGGLYRLFRKRAKHS
jgi:CDP-diacylglycerol--glycerol-3-phosphate 3-phosphatidyltransferase